MSIMVEFKVPAKSAEQAFLFWDARPTEYAFEELAEEAEPAWTDLEGWSIDGRPLQEEDWWGRAVIASANFHMCLWRAKRARGETNG